MGYEQLGNGGVETISFNGAGFEAFLESAKEKELKAKLLNDAVLFLFAKIDQHGIDEFMASEDTLMTDQADLTDTISAYMDISIITDRVNTRRLSNSVIAPEPLVLHYVKYANEVDDEDPVEIAAIYLNPVEGFHPTYINGTPVEEDAYDYIIETINAITESTRS